MAYKQPITDWKTYRFFPWLEWRRVFLSLSSAPGVPIDIMAFWTERRFNRSGRS
jgi:hypothetical protein